MFVGDYPPVCDEHKKLDQFGRSDKQIELNFNVQVLSIEETFCGSCLDSFTFRPPWIMNLGEKLAAV